jgi:hypothetical protein
VTLVHGFFSPNPFFGRSSRPRGACRLRITSQYRHCTRDAGRDTQTPQLLLIAIVVAPPESDTCERSAGEWWNRWGGWRRSCLGTHSTALCSRFLDRQRDQSPVLGLLFPLDSPPSLVAPTAPVPKLDDSMYVWPISPDLPDACVRFPQARRKIKCRFLILHFRPGPWFFLSFDETGARTHLPIATAPTHQSVAGRSSSVVNFRATSNECVG